MGVVQVVNAVVDAVVDAVEGLVLNVNVDIIVDVVVDVVVGVVRRHRYLKSVSLAVRRNFMTAVSCVIAVHDKQREPAHNKNQPLLFT